ncbi:MAG TPA: F0F1 ATP synthase subunit delta [Candidatus Saccharimonadales bacterium]|nr:F0F1 ATP synthase subunit delta [Candidatus Saccharimonadales bacterium]
MSFSRAKLADKTVDLMSTEDEKTLAKKLAAYLIETGKTSELNSLSRDIMQARKSRDGIVELTAISAHKLSDEQIKAIEKTVIQMSPNAKEVIVNERIDGAVVGGVRLEFANHLLDLSVSAKLNKLKQLTTN